MNISHRFRQDLGYYLLGVIIPGAINAITIPVLKKILGSASFGVYGIHYNFLLLLASFSVGWLCQSLIRFKFTITGQENFFYRRIFSLGSVVIISFAFIALAVNFYYYHQSIAFSLLFSSSIIFCCYQNMLIGLSQANFLSRFTMYSEAIRTATFFISAMFLLNVKILPSLDALFIALNISYLVSAILLFRKNELMQKLFIEKLKVNPDGNFKTGRIFSYGLPLAIWYLISYIILFVDKPLLAHNLGHEVQGNYQALYELISKGAVVLLIPVLYALFPLLTNAFENNDIAKGMQLLKRLILIELGLLVVGLIAYWLFGFFILKHILSVPDTMDYKLCGFFMLASILIWQIGMLMHKPFELKKETNMLLRIILVSLAVFLILFFIIKTYPPVEVYKYTMPFLAASITYVFLCLIMAGYYKKMKADIKDFRYQIKQKLFG